MTMRRQAARRGETQAERRWRFGRMGMVFGGAGVTLLAMLGAWAVLGAVEDKDFPIRVLRVEGSFAHVGAEQVAQTVAPHAAAGFFDTNVAAAKQSLEALPWVDAASVRRVWPDVLHVTIAEQRSAARWGSGALLNPRGEVFTPRSVLPDHDLPFLEGPPRTAPQVLAFYHKASKLLAPIGLRIADLRLDTRRAWQLQLDNGIKLVLGREQGIVRLQRFARFYPDAVARRAAQVAEVDLRYTNGFAVKWRAQGGETLNASRMPSAQQTGDNA